MRLLPTTICLILIACQTSAVPVVDGGPNPDVVGMDAGFGPDDAGTSPDDAALGADARDGATTDTGGVADATSCRAPGCACDADSDCDEGGCLVGRCTQPCTTSAECDGLDTSCRDYSCREGFNICAPTTELGCTCERDDDCVGLRRLPCFVAVCEESGCQARAADSFCSSAWPGCEAEAPALPLGERLYGTIEMGLGTPPTVAFFPIEITSGADVEILYEMDRLDIPPPRGRESCDLSCRYVEGEGTPVGCCDPVSYNVSLQRECDPTNLLEDPTGGVMYRSDPAGFRDYANHSRRRWLAPSLPAGRYQVRVDANPGFGGGGSDRTRGFAITVSTREDPAPTCASTLSATSPVSGETMTEHVTGTCIRGVATVAPVAMHPFVVEARTRVRLEASSQANLGVTMRLRDGCDPADATLACSTQRCLAGSLIEAVLEPGSYAVSLHATGSAYSVVEDDEQEIFYRGRSTPYTVSMSETDVDMACDGASVVSLGRSGAVLSGDTSGEPDRILINPQVEDGCDRGDGPDQVFFVDVEEAGTMTLELEERFFGLRTALFRDCGEDLVVRTGGGYDVTPGRYVLFVGGLRLGAAGVFQIRMDLQP